MDLFLSESNSLILEIHVRVHIDSAEELVQIYAPMHLAQKASGSAGNCGFGKREASGKLFECTHRHYCQGLIVGFDFGILGRFPLPGNADLVEKFNCFFHPICPKPTPAPWHDLVTDQGKNNVSLFGGGRFKWIKKRKHLNTNLPLKKKHNGFLGRSVGRVVVPSSERPPDLKT